MKTVQRGNKQLRVADDRLEDMVKSGYVEVDGKTGRPVNPPAKEPSAAALKRENATLRKENEDLRARVDTLTARLKAQDTPDPKE